jgi:hypothetical protein
MKRLRAVAIATLLVIAVAVLGMPAGAQSANKPAATETGVTANEIHVATIADVDNPAAPNVFLGAKYGAEGAAKYLNSKAGGGGVGGRKIVVDFLDSQLNANTTRNKAIEACGQDFALVGTTVVFLTNVDDIVNCTDKAGAKTGLPDMASFTTGLVESCAPTTYAIVPPQLDCATANMSPQTYRVNIGISNWLIKQSGKTKLHGGFVYGTDTKDTEVSSRAIADGYIESGIKADVNQGLPSFTPQSGYTSIVSQMKTANSNFGYGSPNFMNEATLQGLNDVTWICGNCSPSNINSVTDPTHVYAVQGFLPFDEGRSNAMLNTFLKYVPADKVDQFAAYSWSAMLAFAQAARAVVAKDGVNGLTRANYFKNGVSTLTSFDAGGMMGKFNLYQHELSPCVVVLGAKGGKLERAFPAKKGTFNCAPSNVLKIKRNYQS